MIATKNSSITLDAGLLSQLFASPWRNHCLADKKAMTGYIPLAQETTTLEHGPDDKELWHICRFENILPSDESFFPENILPKNIEADSVLNVYRALDVISNSYLDDLAKSHPEYAETFNDYKYGHNILRFLHYPAIEKPKPHAIPPHKDSSSFSVLVFQNGGEFKYLEDDLWKTFKTTQREVLILPGLLLEYMTHGKIKAVEHTVTYLPREERFSALFFVHPKPHQEIELKFPHLERPINATCADFLGKHARELGISY